MQAPETQLRPGSDEDFAGLYQNLYPRLARSLSLMLGDWAEGEDCAQEAFAKAYRAWPEWKPDAPAEAWVWRIGVNTAHSRIRRRKLGEVGELLRRLGRPQARPDPADLASRSDVAAALRRLRPKEASAVVLRYLHGYSNVEIAELLDVDVRTVTRLLTRATDRLRHDLGEAWRPQAVATSVAEGIQV